jgi:hypothetical protein
MKPWIKKGLTEGTKLFAIFIGINIVWALVLFVFHLLNINPGFGLLALFGLAIYAGSLIVEKMKSDIEDELEKKETKDEA